MKVEEGKRFEEFLNDKFKNKFVECSKLEVVTLRSNIKKQKNRKDKFKKISTLLDDILANKKDSKDKGGLGFKKGESSQK